MKQANIEVRELAKSNGVRHWQIAERLGISETTLVKRLHRELNDKQREQITQVIKDIAHENEEGSENIWKTR